MRTFEADIHTCQGCYGLDAKRVLLRDSKGSGYGQYPRLFYIGDLDGS